MERLPTVWVQSPDEEADEPTSDYLIFTVKQGWVATDRDQLLLGIEIVERNGTDHSDEPVEAILKQFGGEGLLNTMLMADQDLEPGSSWYLEWSPDLGRTVEEHDV